MKNSRYNGALDWWKFVFCIIIVIFHAGIYYGGDKYLFSQGRFGVEFFFVVSGYLMCVSSDKNEKINDGISLGKETFSFVLHKLKRILPAYLLCFILRFCVWLNYEGLEYMRTESVEDFIYKCIYMLPCLMLLNMSGVKCMVLMYISWYISAMLIAMLVIYPLNRKYKDSYRMIVAPLSVLLLSGYMYNVGDSTAIAKYEIIMTTGLIRAFIGLNIGCLAFEFSNYLRKCNLSEFKRWILGAVELILYMTIIAMLHYGGESGVYIINILLLGAVTITTSQCSPVAGVFNNSICKFLGEASLYIYLFQAPVKAVVYYEYPYLSFKTGCIYIFVATFIVAGIAMICVKLYETIKKKYGSRIYRLFVA
jgi:peptidoglycan/LPS O-acetylase OafA/YrhL